MMIIVPAIVGLKDTIIPAELGYRTRVMLSGDKLVIRRDGIQRTGTLRKVQRRLRVIVSGDLSFMPVREFFRRI